MFATFLLVLGLSLVDVPSALAWSNGTNGYNSYGTHDWSSTMR